jgi:hypothetical protein
MTVTPPNVVTSTSFITYDPATREVSWLTKLKYVVINLTTLLS